jgi:hypothetical protein
MMRRNAALYRRLARIPTADGHRADRILTGLAERLEQKARTEQAQRHAITKSSMAAVVSKLAQR